jgi:hypothetical protein
MQLPLHSSATAAAHYIPFVFVPRIRGSAPLTVYGVVIPV